MVTRANDWSDHAAMESIVIVLILFGSIAGFAPIVFLVEDCFYDIQNYHLRSENQKAMRSKSYTAKIRMSRATRTKMKTTVSKRITKMKWCSSLTRTEAYKDG